jgi:hypothetical protein
MQFSTLEIAGKKVENQGGSLGQRWWQKLEAREYLKVET